MQEHERPEYERLRGEGRWKEANEFREAERRRLRAEGRSREVACNESWSAMLSEFPPLPVGAVAETWQEGAEIPKHLLERVPVDRKADSRSVAEWVFQNAYCDWESVSIETAPGLGAVGLLAWVKLSAANYGEFVRTIWVKLLPSKAEMESEARFSDDGRKQLKLLEEFEASLNAESSASQSR